MKVKILISFYKNEGGHKVYLEKDFKQAELDLEMIQGMDDLGKDYELQETTLYGA